MPNRCAFLIDVSIILSAIHLAFILGIEVPVQVEAGQKKVLLIVTLLVTGVVFMLDGFGISNIKVRQISKNLSDGVYQTHYQASRDFLDSLNQYEKGTDVLIPAQELPAAIRVDLTNRSHS